MKQITAILLVILLLTSCGSKKEVIREAIKQSATLDKKQELLNEDTFVVDIYSDDKTYGYTEKNPIKVGGCKTDEGPLNERRFLNALAGPNKESIEYQRLGSCCRFETPNGLFGNGFLDRYAITYKGLKEPIILYINMYDSDTLKVPVGFKLKYNYNSNSTLIAIR